MADISEILGEKDPDALKKLLELRDKINYGNQSIPVPGAAEQSAKVFQNMPRTAAESAEILQNVPELAQPTIPPQQAALSSEEALTALRNYNQPGAMSTEDALSQMGKSSEIASAASDVPATAEEYMKSVPKSSVAESAGEVASVEGNGILRGLGGMAAKSALPLASLYELLKSHKGPEGLQDYSPSVKTMLANQSKPLPLPYGGLEGKALDDYIKSHPGPVANIGYNPSASDSNKENNVVKRIPSSPSNSNNAVGLIDKLNNLKSNPTKNPAPINDTIARLLGKNQDDLKDAREQRGQLQLLAMMGKAGSQIGSALAPLAPHQAPDNTAFNALIQASQQPVNDIKENESIGTNLLKNKVLEGQANTEMQKTNPNSDISKTYRDLYEQMGHTKVNPNMSAMELEKLEPLLARRAAQEEAAKQRAFLAQQSNGFKQSLLDQRVESQTNEQVRKETGNYTQSLDQANRLNSVLNDVKSGKYPSSQNVAGAIQSDIAQLLANSKSTAVYDRSHGEIKSLESTWNKIASYATSKPMDTIPPAYINQLETEMNTLRHKILESYKRKNNELLSGTTNQSKKNIINNRYETQVKGVGFNPNTLEKAQDNSHPQDEEAIAWAKANPGPDADKILKANGL